MSDFIDFVVRFKEQGLAAINSNANSLLGGLNRTLNNTQAQTRNATLSIAAMNRQLDALKRRRDISVDTRQIAAANREIAALEARINSLSGSGSSGGGMGGFLKGGLIAGGVAAAVVAGKALIVDSIQAAMAYNTRVKSFEVLTGNATRGRALAGSLRDMKMNSLVGGGVYQNAQTMLGFGVNENSLLKKIHEVGDVGMGDTDKMGSLTLARAQTTAAGKLMGQDLLQYVNAGFNPLQVMAEKWQEFGFKTKKTIGELKDLMEQGTITSGMVDKTFTLATSKGGRFYNMMDQIGETAGGKFLKLKGAWAATQIDIGNSLMPLASSAMEAANSLLHLVHIGETVPESLRTERLEANTLVSAITQLNAGSTVRAQLIDQLKGKYPDFFGDLDTEKVKNQELLSILDKVNGAYGKRIDVADHAYAANVAKDEKNDLLSLAQKARMQAEYSKTHTSFWDKTKYLTVYDRFFKEGMVDGNTLGDMDYNGLIQLATQAEKKAGALGMKQSTNENYVKNAGFNDLVHEAFQLNADGTKKEQSLWGNNYKKNLPQFSEEMMSLRKMYSENGGKFTGSFLNYDYTRLQGLVHPDGSGDGGLSGAVDETGKKISGGGSKQLIINLNAPMIKDQTFHVNSMAEAKQYSRRDQEEIFASIIHSIKQGL